VLQEYTRSQTARGAVGILCNAYGDPYSMPIVHGAAEKLASEGFHTICFHGGFPSAPIYLMADGLPVVPAILEGLILLSGTARGFSRELEQMAARSTQVVVSIGAAIPNLSSVAANDEAGAFQAVAHLVKHHDRKRVAFIGGPAESADGARRLAAYRLALESFKLPCDPALFVRGDYEARSGREAVLQLCRFGAGAFDAIVAANDLMAIGALEALHAAQIRVPEDVAVIGFDDMEEASFVSPALTTVRQPVYEQGISAASLVSRYLRGEALAEQPELIPAPLVVRRSCGCNAGAGGLRGALATGADANQDQDRLEDALRGSLRRELSGRRAHRELSILAEEILSVNDFPGLASTMTGAFRLLNIRRFLVCLYTEDQRKAQVVLESSGRDVLFRNRSQAFPLGQLLPSGFLGRGKPVQLAIEPLKLADEHFGYMVMEVDARVGQAHLELRHLLSSALSRIARSKELRRLYTGERKGAEQRRASSEMAAAPAVEARSDRPPALSTAPPPAAPPKSASAKPVTPKS
jgi:DNA-binding LacI/PurR family transcriptional regulator